MNMKSNQKRLKKTRFLLYFHTESFLHQRLPFVLISPKFD